MDLLRLASAATRDTVITMAEKGFEKRRNEIVDLATTPLAALLLGSGSKFLFDLSIALLKALLDSEDKLDEIRNQLIALTRAPVETALDLLRTLSNTSPSNEIEKAYVIDRYRQALVLLDSAHTLSPTEEKPILLLLRAAVALRLPGGYLEASHHFGVLASLCEVAADVEEAGIPILEDDASKCSAQAARIPTSAGSGHAGGGLPMWEEALDAYRKGELQRQAKKNRELVAASREAIEQYRDSAVVFRRLGELSSSSQKSLETPES